ncbi:MAG: nucleoside phosphorylase, partial [Acidimicrobiales bacterium]
AGTGPALPILEYDDASEAMIEPRHVFGRREGVPRAMVICFFAEIVDEVCAEGRADVVLQLGMESPRPLYSLDIGRGRRVAVLHPGVGAPMVTSLMEEAIALGCERFVACGGAGALVPGLALGHVVVPNAAVRDEGTSYHYLAPEREVAADPDAVAVAVAVLERNGVPHTVAKTWSTDAPFRETAARVERRRAEGCVTVEMETAAFFAVARHRGVRFTQYLYAGDDLSGEAWDHRSWQAWSSRRALFDLAVEACLEL